MLSSISKLFSDVPKTLLKEHYRCHPKIIDFCNKKFYDGKLIILTDENSCDTTLEVYKTVQGNNERQIDVIVKEILPKLNGKEPIGIVSPYRNQIGELRAAISNENIESEKLLEFFKKHKKVSKYNSENLMNVLIENIKF